MEEEKEVPDNVIRIVEVKAKEESTDSSEIFVRLTPTGRISHAKTRVYTQRYRKEWETMHDFKDWLTSVPYQATRAFCKYCQRNLHAHRLSLLKHMCTLKHQRAAVLYNKVKSNDQPGQDINYIIETLDGEENDEEDEHYEDLSYLQGDEQGEEMSIEEDMQEEIVEESESEVESPNYKKIKIQTEDSKDTLGQTMAQVHQADYLAENEESVQAEAESDNDNNENVIGDHDNDNCTNDTKQKAFQFVQCGVVQQPKCKSNVEDENYVSSGNKQILTSGVSQPLKISKESLKTVISQASDNSKKMVIFSSGGKTYTLVKKKVAPQAINQLQDRTVTVVPNVVKNDLKKSEDESVDDNSNPASTSQETLDKNTSSTSGKSILLKKPFVSTNVLDTGKGVHIVGLQVSLYKLHGGRWTFMYESITDVSGNCNDFSNTKTPLTTGRYKLHYDVEKYYNSRKMATIYPFIEIVFDIKDPNGSYHIPLLVSPYSYSTYKGIQK